MTLSVPRSQSADSSGSALRVLTNDDWRDFIRLISTDPDAYCVVGERTARGLNSQTAGGVTLGWFVDDRLTSAIFVGPNVIPIETSQPARRAFAERMAIMGRRSSAIVGYREEVLDLWSMLEDSWGQARDVRANQPLMTVIDNSAAVADLRVRAVEPVEVDALLGPSIAMFEEEVGVSPVAGGRGASYRARLSSAIRAGQVYAVISDGEVLFKAEVGAVSRDCAQIQGVWVQPRLRGSGICAPAMARVVELVLRDHAPRACLYANHHNVAALRCYANVGFRQVGTFATVLF